MKGFIGKYIRKDIGLKHPSGGEHSNQTRIIVVGSLLACFTTILQSAGMFGGIGFLISALSTLPILIGTFLSYRMGILSYISAFLLILFIQPSEFFVYPFTTGLLGISMGFSIRFFKKGIFATLFSGLTLTLGILIILYIIRFPVLGPTISTKIDVNTILIILIFSTVYSWGWLKLSFFVIKRVNWLWRK